MAAARTDAATPSAVADPTNSQRAQLGAGVSPPVVEYNKGNVRDVNAPQRANFTPLSEGLLRQGLIRDTERGVGTSSGRRESPSQVLGILSPRGNSYVADDQEGNEFIRLRTRSGTQVLIHETTGYVYINSKGGNAWLEISDDGVDIYSKNSVSIRAEKDFNIRADQNIHLDAGQDFAIRAGRNITMESGVKSTFKSGDELILESGAKTSFKAVGDFLVRTDANFRNEAAGEVSSKAGGNQIRVGAAIKDNSGAPAAVEAVPAVVPTGANLHGTQTIASRMPTHEPWPMHPRSDVPARQPASLSAGDIQRIAQRQGQPVTNGEGTDNSQRPQQNACAGGGQTRPVSTEVYNAIREASDRSGVNFGTLMAFADIESGFRPGVQARGSSATGLFQMVDGTWNSMVSRHGGTYNVGYGDRSDARGNAMMGAAYIAENQQLLQRNGLNTGPTELYMAHFLGGGGATRFLTARNSNGDQNAASMFPSAAASNPSIFYEGGAGGRPRTLNEIYGNMQRRVEPRAQAYAEQYGQPPPCERPDNDTGGAVNPPAAGNGTVPI